MADVAPTVHLTSGQKFRLLKVMLYDEKPLKHSAELRAQAAKVLGGTGTGFGVIGSPNLTFAAEAAAVGLISGILANAAQKTALNNLKQAQVAFEQARATGGYFDAEEINGISQPDPARWSALGDLRDTRINLGEIPAEERKELCEKNNIKFVSWEPFVTLPMPIRYIHHGEEFTAAQSGDGEIYFRWSQVASFVLA